MINSKPSKSKFGTCGGPLMGHSADGCASCSPEEDVVALVVEGHDPPATKVGILTKQRREQAPHAAAQHRVEVVQDQLRLVRGRPSMPLSTAITIDNAQ